MGGIPPTPKELARWLLACEGVSHAPSEGLPMAAVSLYEQLRTHLARLLGVEGFDALWARALHLVQQTSLRPDIGALPPSLHASHHLEELVQGRTVAEAHDALLAVFTQFLTLLFTFIGADLSFRLLQQQWPTLLAPLAGEYGEEAQQ